MKSAVRKSAPSTTKKKPQRRWLKKVVSLLDQWSAEDKELALVHGPVGFSTRNFGQLRKLSENWYIFSDSAGAKVSLMPDCWDSAKIEKGAVDREETLIRAAKSGNDFTLTDGDLFKRQKPGAIDAAVYDQLKLWLGNELNVIFNHGFQAIVGRLRLKQFSTSKVYLFDEKTNKVHMLSLEAGQHIDLKREEGYCTISFSDADSGSVIEVSDWTPEDALARFALLSSSVH
jgi:hypothetical protein